MCVGVPVDIAEQDEFAIHSYTFYLLPRLWRECVVADPLGWTVAKFEDNSRDNIPTQSGIYTFLLQPGIADHPSCSYLMYVGQASNLATRFGNYLTTEQKPTGRPKLRRFFYRYEGYIWFCYTQVPANKLDDIESALLAGYVPPLNSQLPGSIRAARGAF